MGNQNARNQDTVLLAQINGSENYQPQIGAYANNQYSINSNYSASNGIPNSQQAYQQNVKVQNEQQQSIPNITNIPPIPSIPPIPTQPIQLGIPVIQQLEIEQIPQQPLTNDLKDQPFHIKKNEVIKALIKRLNNFLSFFYKIYNFQRCLCI